MRLRIRNTINGYKNSYSISKTILNKAQYNSNKSIFYSSKLSPKLYSKQVITPWEVHSEDEKGIDYDHLIDQFGTKLINKDNLESIMSYVHNEDSKANLQHFFERDIFFSHRGMENMNAHNYIYTGRGPSSESMHIGHLIPFWFTKTLSDAWDAPLVIQMTNDEKYLWRHDLDRKAVKKATQENARDILSLGFNRDKTFMFSNFEFMNPAFYEMVIRIQKKLTGSQVKSTFGIEDRDNIGKFGFCAVQAAPSFAETFPHILYDPSTQNDPLPHAFIPSAIDQDPYFRLTRDVARRIKLPPPTMCYSRFFPSLQGHSSKMSASDPKSSILLTDNEKTIHKKIKKFAFSGGQATAELQREFGANLESDVSIAYLRFFMKDSSLLATIEDDYASGKILTGELKKILANELWSIIQPIQERRHSLTDDEVSSYFEPRLIT